MSGAIGSILSNSGALTALNGISAAQQSNDSYEQQLSSGQKVNSPSDNPAGFITAQGFTSQINGVSQASSNASEGISLLQTAQGAVQQQLNVAQKLNSIAVQAANGTQTAEEAQSLQGVVSQLTGQVSTIANQTQFNNISLLDGTFSGVQFQVGANEGQTLSLSIGSTSADTIGMNTLDASTGASAKFSAGSSADVTASGAGFGAGTLAIQGANGKANVTVAATDSAATIAASINQHTNQTGVTAQARTELDLTATGSSFNFTLGNGNAAGVTNSVSISATSKSGLVDAINGHTAKTGITAKQDTAGNVVLTQGDGKNISITGITSGKLTSVGNSTAASSGGTDHLVAQGKISFQSDAAFHVGSASAVGLKTQSNLEKLSSIDVSTTAGANKAINVVKYAIQGLNNLGGQLGATQQRMQATLNNLTTTQSNLQNGLSAVQDANIPEVTQKLTQSQIQAQAGVSALKSSSRLQQSYLSLLP